VQRQKEGGGKEKETFGGAKRGEGEWREGEGGAERETKRKKKRG